MTDRTQELREAARLGLLKLNERVDAEDLMNSGSELGLVGMEWNDEGGFAVERKVVVTEPWRPSLVRLGERPRVQRSTKQRACEWCGSGFKTTGRGRYCSESHKQLAKRARVQSLVTR